MSYFSSFPYIEYEFPDGITRNIKDLSRRAAFMDDYFSLSNDLETYSVVDGETPEIVAFNAYGDVGLNWIVMLSNNILNVYKDWPKSNTQFDDYIYNKYKTVKTVNGKTVTLTKDQCNELIEWAGMPVNQFSTFIELDDSDNDKVLARPHHFTDDNGFSYSYDTAIQDSDLFVDAFNKVVVKPENLKAVSIYEYEFLQNEKKRIIVIPSSAVVDQLRKELREIINE